MSFPPQVGQDTPPGRHLSGTFVPLEVGFLSQSCNFETFLAWWGCLKEGAFQVSPEGHWGTWRRWWAGEGQGRGYPRT